MEEINVKVKDIDDIDWKQKAVQEVLDNDSDEENNHANVEVGEGRHLSCAWHGDIPVLPRDGIYSDASSRCPEPAWQHLSFTVSTRLPNN